MRDHLTLLRTTGLLFLVGGAGALLYSTTQSTRCCQRQVTPPAQQMAVSGLQPSQAAQAQPFQPWRATLLGEGVHRLLSYTTPGVLADSLRSRQPAAGSYSYRLAPPAIVQSLYPDASWLPSYYTKDGKYQDISSTVETFTSQSLQRDGIIATGVRYDNTTGIVTIQTSLPSAAASYYAQVHPLFMKIGLQAQGGVQQCQQTSGCWDPHPGYAPWAMFLPFGLPMVNQLAISFLDYPPSTSLSYGDYLNNFTMNRWTEVMQAVGIPNPILYQTTVDARPIAAPGSGQTNYLPDATTYFNDPANHYYLTPMISLLTQPPTAWGNPATRPVTVLGTPARAAWGKIVGQTVNVLSVGTTLLPGAKVPTPWVAGNHPDVTSYQCCPGDPNASCSGSYNLVSDEQIDFQVLCITQLLAQSPGLDPNSAAATCKQQWGLPFSSLSSTSQHALCVQAKQDYEYKSTGQCKTAQDAEAFCNYYQNNPCPTNVYTCTLPSGG
jgi:hypothetical protein